MSFQIGSCVQADLPEVNWGVLNALNLMRPVDVHAWAWVYLMISFCWLISSVTILICTPPVFFGHLIALIKCIFLTDVRREYIIWANIFLYFWIAITLAVSIIDLALGILFGLDYDQIMVNKHNIK